MITYMFLLLIEHTSKLSYERELQFFFIRQSCLQSYGLYSATEQKLKHDQYILSMSSFFIGNSKHLLWEGNMLRKLHCIKKK